MNICSLVYPYKTTTRMIQRLMLQLNKTSNGSKISIKQKDKSIPSQSSNILFNGWQPHSCQQYIARYLLCDVLCKLLHGQFQTSIFASCKMYSTTPKNYHELWTSILLQQFSFISYLHWCWLGAQSRDSMVDLNANSQTWKQWHPVV